MLPCVIPAQAGIQLSDATVIPAQAGIQLSDATVIPAKAGIQLLAVWSWSGRWEEVDSAG
jgi:hypothetical protein